MDRRCWAPHQVQAAKDLEGDMSCIVVARVEVRLVMSGRMTRMMKRRWSVHGVVEQASRGDAIRVRRYGTRTLGDRRVSSESDSQPSGGIESLTFSRAEMYSCLADTFFFPFCLFQ